MHEQEPVQSAQQSQTQKTEKTTDQRATGASAGQSTELIMRSAASGFGSGGFGGAAQPGSPSAGQSAELSAASLMNGGSALHAGMRGSLEAATGQDLSGVRVHADGQAASAAQSVGAQAFAIGQHVHFGAGQYNPSTSDGQHLIAHEVAHTIQQRDATMVQGMPTVSSPTDAHEIEAERFATQFAMGGPMPGLTPISKGGVARATIQRQTKPPTVDEMVKALEQQIVALRPQGPKAVVAKVKTMRAQADTAKSKKVVELAIAKVLNDAERAVLEGREPPQDAKTSPPATKGKGKGTVDLTKGDGEPPADTVDKKDTGDPKSADKGKPKGKGSVDPKGGNQVTPTTATTPKTTTPNAPGTAKPIDASQRTLVQQELAFHENWKALSGGAGSRALHLLKSAPGDIGGGMVGAGTQVAGGLLVEFAANKLPVPGIGNMAGGLLSGVWMWKGGAGAAITDLQQGLKALDPSSNIGGLQRAADIVQMLKSLMDLVGNVCNIISGLAYAGAALATLGALVSWFFPPLLAVVPYIPTLINVGRMAGGVAQICIAISNLISPIPPAFRALHIITSNDDPIKLVAQEEQYHSELQGAIANYMSAGVMSARQARATAKTDGKPMTKMETVKHAANPINQGKTMWGGLKDGAASVKDSGAEFRRNADGVRFAKTKEAIGMDDKTVHLRSERLRLAKEHNTDAQKQRLDGASRQMKAEKDQQIAAKKDEIDGLKAKIKKQEPKVAKAKRRPKGKKQRSKAQEQQELSRLRNKVKKLENDIEALNTSHQQRENRQAGLRGRWGGRGAKGDVQGEAGAALDNARGASNDQELTADGKHTVERDKKGHVKLPTPPGTMEQVDTLESEIKGLQSTLKKQQQNTQSADTHGQTANTQSKQLQQVGQGTDARKADLDKGKTQHQKVAQDTTDARTKTTQKNTAADQNLKKAADALRPIAPPIRMLNTGVQAVPSNRFFNVKGTQKNLQEMTNAVDEVTGADAKQKTAQEQAKVRLDTRDTLIKKADTTRAANQTAITDFKAKVKADQEKTTQVAADSTQQAKKSKQAELTLEQQIQQKTQEKQQKWSRLKGWAQQHNSLRRMAG